MKARCKVLPGKTTKEEAPKEYRVVEEAPK